MGLGKIIFFLYLFACSCFLNSNFYIYTVPCKCFEVCNCKFMYIIYTQSIKVDVSIRNEKENLIVGCSHTNTNHNKCNQCLVFHI
jgi:hypothetical protein